MIKREIIIVGGGPAGMAAAVKLSELGFRDVLVIEKENRPGGVLRQCIHPGFGLTSIGKNYTGPEYSRIYEDRLAESSSELMTGATVMSIKSRESHLKEAAHNGTKIPEGRIVVTAATSEGMKEYMADAVILASGCRERGRGFLKIPGSRPAGIYTAGTAQGMMNLRNVRVGNRMVIVGSGDIGLIMARRFTLEGCRVVCVVEKEKVCGGLERNLKECLNDFDIPLLTESQVTCVRGKKRVEAVTVRDSSGNETEYECDTLILSAGLVPEDGMAEKDIEGLFYCGNARYVHDLVDDVSESGENAAMDTAGFLLASLRGRDFDSEYAASEILRVRNDRREYVRKRQEQRLKDKASGKTDFIICTMCPNGCRIDPENYTGGKCPKGEEYARREKEEPRRILTGSVLVEGTQDIISVRTDRGISLKLFDKAMEELNRITVDKDIRCGDIICRDFIDKGVFLKATSDYHEVQ